MLTETQLAERQNGVGGSDAGVILGVSPWKTPIQLFLEKTGQAPPPEENDAMRWGSLLEDTVAREAAQQMGVKFRRRHKALHHPARPWMLGHIDREIVGQKTLVEIKTTATKNGEWGEDGTDQIPPAYLAQVSHYMAVGNYERAFVPVLFLVSRKMHIYEVKRDKELETILINAEADFWNRHVLTGTPPPPREVEDVARLWPQSNGLSFYADEDMLNLVSELRGLKQEEKALKERRADVEMAVKQNMGACEELLGNDDQLLLTWKTERDSVSVDWEAVAKHLSWGDIEEYALAHGLMKTRKGARKFIVKQPKGPRHD